MLNPKNYWGHNYLCIKLIDQDVRSFSFLILLYPSAEAVTLNDCLQLSYLPSKRNHMLLLYPREILILDLELSQTVGVVAIERSGVPFIQVSRCRHVQQIFIRDSVKLDKMRVC